MPPTSAALVIAALFGACGTALLAAGSHAAGSLATTAGQMLLWHAPAIMAAALARESGRLHRQIGALAVGVLIAGAGLFAADLAVRALLGWPRLFPMAAPLGGMLTIGGWIALAISALITRRP